MGPGTPGPNWGKKGALRPVPLVSWVMARLVVVTLVRLLSEIGEIQGVWQSILKVLVCI